MYHRPSQRVENQQEPQLNLIPILDSVFILIFFLLVTSTFINLFQISTPVPIESDSISKNQEPLALTVILSKNEIKVEKGLRSTKIASFKKEDGKFNLEKINQFFFELKKKHPKEDLAIFEPQAGVKYNEIVQIMDAVRIAPANENDITDLFSEVVFGNLMSTK